MRGLEHVDPAGDPSGPSELERLLFRQERVISTRQALAFMSENAIRHRLAKGRWRRVHRAVLVTHNGAVTRSQRLWAAVLAVGIDRPAVIGGLTALIVRGLRRIQDDAIHVVVPDQGGLRAPAGVKLHRAARLTPDDIDRWSSPPTSWPGQSVVDAACWARSDKEATLIIAASFQQRLVRLREIENTLLDRPNARRRRLIRQVAEECDGGSHSIGELELLRICRRYGLPEPSRQYEWRDEEGRRRYTDAVFDEWKVAAEIEGVQHTWIEVAWDDSARENALRRKGYDVRRFSTILVRLAPAKVAAELREALARGGWIPK